MKLTAAVANAILLAAPVTAVPKGKADGKRDVDTTYPYTGPAVPVGDWIDNTINGNGKGFPRLVEPPAVRPSSKHPTNNINVISVSYLKDGVNIHFQTPFGLTEKPTVHYGTSHALGKTAKGLSKTYARTPPCSEIAIITQCSEHFHNVELTGLRSGTTYYYRIAASNGTTASEVLSFKTSLAAGERGSFTVGVLNDMGYTNAKGTHKQLSSAAQSGKLAFAWHGGDISYADDWYDGILPCSEDWDVCSNGSHSSLPPGDIDPGYQTGELPKGEIPNQGTPQGGDISVIYESNWDLWQQWLNSVTQYIPYQVLPGNHEAACAEFDDGGWLTAYLNNNQTNTTAPASQFLTYYSCPVTQRNFTAYQYRFEMKGDSLNGGRSNFWYSFDYGLAHFVSLNGETDYAYSPEWPFIRDTKGKPGVPIESDTYPTDSGPFGYITGNNYKANDAYEQVNWLKKDLASVDRKKTPWVFVMSHRPMYSTEVSSYQTYMRNAFENIMIEAGVDAYISGHIHWYERTFPIAPGQIIDKSSILDNNTYVTNPGKSMTHLINGAAGNLESHSTVGNATISNVTSVLDYLHYGYAQLNVINATAVKWSYIHGEDGSVIDELHLLKR
ncbi:Metallo-dependent phosphatase-like protein [Xylariaceae sp. FL1651]|nr:Metallo-dependent phosphatase-like protein [Xylariaceae sp. FL1651]